MIMDKAVFFDQVGNNFPWVVPSDVYSIRVFVQGPGAGGGGGGGGSYNYYSGGGGGGGSSGFLTEQTISVYPGMSFYIDIPAGGKGGDGGDIGSGDGKNGLSPIAGTIFKTDNQITMIKGAPGVPGNGGMGASSNVTHGGNGGGSATEQCWGGGGGGSGTRNNSNVGAGGKCGSYKPASDGSKANGGNSSFGTLGGVVTGTELAADPSYLASGGGAGGGYQGGAGANGGFKRPATKGDDGWGRGGGGGGGGNGGFSTGPGQNFSNTEGGAGGNGAPGFVVIRYNNDYFYSDPS
jgi:hypothetical protein